MSYLGNGIFVEHELPTIKATYKIFGIDQPIEIDETEQVVIGTLTSTENETLDKLLESTHLVNTETFQPESTSVEDVSKETTKETEYTSNTTTTKNLVPLEPDFTEDEIYESNIMPTVTDRILLQDREPLDTDQSDKNHQQTGITNAKIEMINCH